MYTPGQAFGGTTPGFSPNTVRSTTCSSISITPDLCIQGTMCKLRHVYNIVVFEQRTTCIGSCSKHRNDLSCTISSGTKPTCHSQLHCRQPRNCTTIRLSAMLFHYRCNNYFNNLNYAVNTFMHVVIILCCSKAFITTLLLFACHWGVGYSNYIRSTQIV